MIDGLAFGPSGTPLPWTPGLHTFEVTATDLGDRIATLSRTGRPVSADVRAVSIVMPAEGPSFGIAPAGTWMWMSDFSMSPGSMPQRSAALRR